MRMRSVLNVALSAICAGACGNAPCQVSPTLTSERPVSKNLALPEARDQANTAIQRLTVPEVRSKLAVEVNSLGNLSATLAKNPGTMREAAPVLDRQLLFAKRAWANAAKQIQTGSDLAALNEVRDALIQTEKAFYSRLIRRNYPPDAYKAIYERSQFAVAIVKKSTGEPFCSAILLGADLILTAKHCLADHTISDLELWSSYMSTLDGSVTAPTRTGLSQVEIASENPVLDYALLRLAAPVSVSGGFPCLSTERVKLKDLVYVLGYPQQRPLTVHDFGEVLYPYQASETELEDIVLSEQLRYKNAESAVSSIKASYQKIADGSTAFYLNMSNTWNGKPTIGIVADTFHGDSGSAVFSRDNHRIVGLFVQGQPDYAEPWTPTWERHEAVLPITRVVEDLTSRQPGLLKLMCVA